MSNMISKIACFFITILVSACTLNQRTSELSDIGSGNISFSVSSTTTYRHYLKQILPKVFVVTVDGDRGFYTFCASKPEEECLDNTSAPLLEVCSEKTGTSCRIFAMDGHVVWKDPGQWRNPKSQGLNYYVDHRGIRTDKL
jgi:hypothetical protein